MAMVKDIDLETDLDLKIIDGDFVISDSDQNHVINILKSYAGGYKQFSRNATSNKKEYYSSNGIRWI